MQYALANRSGAILCFVASPFILQQLRNGRISIIEWRQQRFVLRESLCTPALTVYQEVGGYAKVADAAVHLVEHDAGGTVVTRGVGK